MPTWSTTESFEQDFKKLTPKEKARFRAAIAAFVADIKKRRFRNGLRVKGIQGAEGMFEMTWARNGRATFQYGPPVRAKEPHVVWRRLERTRFSEALRGVPGSYP